MCLLWIELLIFDSFLFNIVKSKLQLSLLNINIDIKYAFTHLENVKQVQSRDSCNSS